MICSKCKIDKPGDAFYNKKASKTGKHSTCKSCDRPHEQSVEEHW